MGQEVGPFLYGISQFGGGDQLGGAPVRPGTLNVTATFPAVDVNVGVRTVVLPVTVSFGTPTVRQDITIAPVVSGLVYGWGSYGDGFYGFGIGYGAVIYGKSTYGGISQRGGTDGAPTAVGVLAVFSSPALVADSVQVTPDTLTVGLTLQQNNAVGPAMSAFTVGVSFPALTLEAGPGPLAVSSVFGVPTLPVEAPGPLDTSPGFPQPAVPPGPGPFTVSSVFGVPTLPVLADGSSVSVSFPNPALPVPPGSFVIRVVFNRPTVKSTSPGRGCAHVTGPSEGDAVLGERAGLVLVDVLAGAPTKATNAGTVLTGSRRAVIAVTSSSGLLANAVRTGSVTGTASAAGTAVVSARVALVGAGQLTGDVDPVDAAEGVVVVPDASC